MIWIKQKLKRFWKWIVGALAIPVALAAPIIPKDQTWLVSYETIAFETADGDLGMNEWADAGNGEFYIREVQKNEGQFISTTSPDALFGKTEVRIRAQKSANNPDCTGCAYYSEFLARDGKKERVPYEGRYNDLREIPNAPQPKRTEMVNMLSADNAEAAIAFDTAGDSNVQTSVTSVSFNHTTSSTDNTIAVITAKIEDPVDAERNASTATYGGASATKVREDDNTTDGHATAIFYIVAPSTGEQAVVVNFADGTMNAVTTGVIVLTGVAQSSSLDASNGASFTNTDAPSVAVTTVADNAWVVDIVGCEVASCVTSSGTTIRWNCTCTTLHDAASSTSGPQTPAGDVTMSYTLNATTRDGAISAASFKPFVVAAAGGKKTHQQ